MTKNILSILILLLITNRSFAACDMAIMFNGNNPNLDLALRLESSLEKQLKKLNTKNSARLISIPEDASESDYFLLLSQTYSGVRVAINYVLLNNTFYSKEYKYNSFISNDQIIFQISNDVANGAFSSMKLCK